MSGQQVVIERHVDIAEGVSAEIIRWSTPPHCVTTYRQSRHLVCRRLSSMGTYRGWVKVSGIEQGFDLAQTRLMPADISVRADIDAHDSVRTLLCWIAKDKFESLAPIGDDWNQLLLGRCYNLQAAMVDDALLKLASEMCAPGFATGIVTESLINLIMVYVSRALESRADVGAGRTGGLTQWQLKLILQYVEESGDPRPTLSKLAQLCGLSRGHLIRAFKQTVGCTVHEHVERVRLRRAIAMLQEGRASLKQIAAALGFANACSFSQAFQRLTGTAPTEFRRRARVLDRSISGR